MKKSIIIIIIIAILAIGGIFAFIKFNKDKTSENKGTKSTSNTSNINSNTMDNTYIDSNTDTDTGTVNVSSESSTMTYNSDSNKKTYKFTFVSNSENNQMYSYTQYPTTSQIVNEIDNFRIDIQIDDLTKAENDMTISEEKKNSDWKEEKFGNFNGSTYTDVIGTRTIRVLIDDSNPEGVIYATLILDFEDSSNKKGITLDDLYKSSEVQYIINNIKCTIENK